MDARTTNNEQDIQALQQATQTTPASPVDVPTAPAKTVTSTAASTSSTTVAPAAAPVIAATPELTKYQRPAAVALAHRGARNACLCDCPGGVPMKFTPKATHSAALLLTRLIVAKCPRKVDSLQAA